MALTVEDQGLNAMSFLWENHSWDLSNSDNLDESKENMKSLNQKEEKDETLMNKKRNRDHSTITSGEEKRKKCREPEMHMWTERERRKKMKNMFESLHALLPHLPTKADKLTVLDETLSYIKNLEQTLKKLEKLKQERAQCISTFGSKTSMFVTGQTQGSSISNNFSNENMGLETTTITTSNAFSFPGPELGPQPVVAFDKTWVSPNLVLNICGDEAQFSIYAARKPGLITTIAFVLEKYKIDVTNANISRIGNGNARLILAHGKRVSNQLLDASLLDEIYQQAAKEMIMWIA